MRILGMLVALLCLPSLIFVHHNSLVAWSVPCHWSIHAKTCGFCLSCLSIFLSPISSKLKRMVVHEVLFVIWVFCCCFHRQWRRYETCTRVNHFFEWESSRSFFITRVCILYYVQTDYYWRTALNRIQWLCIRFVVSIHNFGCPRVFDYLAGFEICASSMEVNVFWPKLVNFYADQVTEDCGLKCTAGACWCATVYN